MSHDQAYRGSVGVDLREAMHHDRMPPFVLVRDSREQQEPPWPTHVGSAHRRRSVQLGPRVALGEGDYSSTLLVGIAVVERKNPSDYASSCTWDRERLERELARLAEYDHKCFLVEASFEAVCALTGASTASLEGTTDSFFARDCPVYFAANAAHVGRSICGILARWERRYLERKDRIDCLVDAMQAEPQMRTLPLRPRVRKRVHRPTAWELLACRAAGCE